MELLGWIFGGILLLDVLFVGWVAYVEFVGRRHERRELRALNGLWRSAGAWPVRRSVKVGASGRWASASGLGRGGRAAPAVATGVGAGLAGRREHAGHRESVARMAGARLSAATLLVAFVVMAAIIVTAPAPTPGWSGPADRSERALGGRRSADEWDAPSRREAGARTLPSREGAPGSLDRPDHPSIPVSTATIVPDEIAAQPRSSTAIRLVWDSVPQAIGYLIHRSETPSSDWTAIAEIADGETAYTDTGLESNTTYFYRIAAVVEDGPAPPSDIVSATTPVAPPAATEVSATSDPLVTLTWFDVGDETGYRIERSSSGTDGWAMIGTTGQDVTAYTDGDLAPGTYHYRVVAVNEGGDSQPSNVVAVTVPEQEPGVDPPPSNGSDSEEPSDPEVSNGSDSVEPSDPEATSGSAAVEPSEPEATEASLSITPSAST